MLYKDQEINLKQAINQAIDRWDGKLACMVVEFFCRKYNLTCYGVHDAVCHIGKVNIDFNEWDALVMDGE